MRRGGWLQEPHQALWGQVSQAVCAKTSFSIYFYFLGISPKHFQAPLRRPACVWHQLSLNQPPSRSAGATTRSPRGDPLVLFYFLSFFPSLFPQILIFFPSLSAGSSPPEVLRGGAVTGKRDPGSARPGPAAALRPAPGARGLKMAALGLLLQAAAGCGSAGPLRLCRRYRGARGLCSRLPAPESTEEARQEEEEEPQPAATAAAGGEGQDGGAAMGMGEAAGDKPNRHKPKRVKPSRNGLS